MNKIVLVLSLVVLVPVFTIIIWNLSKYLYFKSISRLPTKLSNKLIENFPSLYQYRMEIFILLGITVMYIVVVVYNMFGG